MSGQVSHKIFCRGGLFLACVDTFVITVIGGSNASITIPGGFPIVLSYDSDYVIGFIYVTGEPAATAFDIEWDAILADGTESDDTPTSVFDPTAPEGSGSETRTALVRGALPDTEGILYNGTIWIRQD